MDKGTFSNIVSAVVLAVSLSLPAGPVQALVLSAGMFAFSGGITNSLAVKMLFDRIPGLVGSGVIPARFQEIREEIKRLILENFFSQAYLREFIADHAAGVDWTAYFKSPGSGEGPFAAFVEKSWTRLTDPEVIRPLVDQQIEKLMDSSLGGFLHLVGGSTVRGVVGDFVDRFLRSMKDKVLEAASRFRIDSGELALDEERLAADLRLKVTELLERKLAELDAERVKHMIEDVIRSHLGWLVVWGNVFGGLMGVLAHYLGR